MVKPLLSFLFLLITLSSFGQKKYIISGTIKDGSTGEQLIGATVRIKELPQSGTATNSYGFYSIYPPEGEYTLLFTYTGYEAIEQKVSLHQNTVINVPLQLKNDLKEVVIRADKPNNDNIASPQMGVDGPDKPGAGIAWRKRYFEDDLAVTGRKISRRREYGVLCTRRRGRPEPDLT
jgi:hypothetical protein